MAKAQASLEKLRAWYAHRQGLDGSLTGTNPSAVLEQCGWARSVGGVSPYLTLFARAGTSREATDAAVAKLQIHELPSARGCTYVLPARDFGLGLTAGRGFNGGEMKVAAKLGVTEKEIAKLCDAVLKALGNGPLDPQGIREATGNASRSLGEEGKKKGLSTTLPLALGELQARGDIRRVSTNGRLDQERYRYALWKENPLSKFKLSEEAAAAELARLFFTWMPPATVDEFRAFTGFTVKATKAAVEPLKLEPFAPADARMMLPADRAKFETFKPSKDAQYALVSGLDSIVMLRQGHEDLLDAADSQHGVFVGKTLGDVSGHLILDRGRIVGLWLYDTATESIVWLAFVKKNRELQKAVARTEEYVRTQLSDARSFSLDSPKSRAPRIEALRRLAG